MKTHRKIKTLDWISNESIREQRTYSNSKKVEKDLLIDEMLDWYIKEIKSKNNN